MHTRVRGICHASPLAHQHLSARAVLRLAALSGAGPEREQLGGPWSDEERLRKAGRGRVKSLKCCSTRQVPAAAHLHKQVNDIPGHAARGRLSASSHLLHLHAEPQAVQRRGEGKHERVALLNGTHRRMLELGNDDLQDSGGSRSGPRPMPECCPSSPAQRQLQLAPLVVAPRHTTLAALALRYCVFSEAAGYVL